MKTPKTSIQPRLNYRADAEGRYSLIIQVIHERHRSILTTPYRLRPEEFDEKTGQAIPTNRTKIHRALIREANDCIVEYLSRLRDIVDRFQKEGKPYTAQDITETGKYGGNCRCLSTFARQVVRELESAGRFGTARSYRSLASAWSKFSRGDRFLFSQLDSRTVAAFGEYLSQRGNKRNTVNFYLRTLRALYNRARLYHYAPVQRNPFKDIPFKTARTPKLAIDRNLLRSLAGSDFGDEKLNEARDMFLFSFYARGMSFVDLCYLKKEKIWNGALHYERQKTHQIFSVSLTPQLREIIDRYDNPDSPWALPCMKRGMYYSTHKDKNLNGNIPTALLYNFYCMSLQYYLVLLREILQRMDCRKLTFNVARHTWATEARSMGVPMPHISEGLGHTSEKTTRFYLAQLDTSTVDKINEKVTKLR